MEDRRRGDLGQPVLAAQGKRGLSRRTGPLSLPSHAEGRKAGVIRWSPNAHAGILASDPTQYSRSDAERHNPRHGRRISARVDKADKIGTGAVGVTKADREAIRVTPDDRSRHVQATEANGHGRTKPCGRRAREPRTAEGNVEHTIRRCSAIDVHDRGTIVHRQPIRGAQTRLLDTDEAGKREYQNIVPAPEQT